MRRTEETWGRAEWPLTWCRAAGVSRPRHDGDPFEGDPQILRDRQVHREVSADLASPGVDGCCTPCQLWEPSGSSRGASTRGVSGDRGDTGDRAATGCSNGGSSRRSLGGNVPLRRKRPLKMLCGPCPAGVRLRW